MSDTDIMRYDIKCVKCLPKLLVVFHSISYLGILEVIQELK
jgi:hypothetical protein